MFYSGAVSSVKIQSFMKFIQDDPDLCRKRIILESRHSRHCVAPGLTYPSDHGPLTVVCIIDPEVWYFQGGLVYFVNKFEFIDLVQEKYISGTGLAVEDSNLRRLTEMEVELILGIVTGVGPLACWTIIGSDLIGFIRKNSKKINSWTERIASLFLARFILKKYSIAFYQKVSGVLTDGAWSSLSEEVATDDAAIARFTGRLLALYGSEDRLEKAICMKWSVVACILRSLEAVVNSAAGAEDEAEKRLECRSRDLVHSLGRLGVRIATREVEPLLHAMYRHPDEIRNAIEIVKSAFGNPEDYSDTQIRI